MKLNKYMNVRRLNATFAILIAAMMALSMSAVVMADTEPNDSFVRAESTYDGAMEYGTLTEADDESDYYSINLHSGDTLTIELTGTLLGGTMANPLGYTISIYSPSYESLMGVAGIGIAGDMVTESVSTYPAVSGSGTHYIEINAEGGMSYTFNVDVSQGYVPPVTDGNFDKATPPSVPWNNGDYVASGGYLDLGTLIDQMKTEMTQDIPEDVDVSISGSGGIGQYILIEYAGMDAGDYKFDYSCRIYAAAKVSGEMTANNVETDGVTVDGTASGKADLTADLLYEGSLWLGYYENPAQTKAYWAAEKMTLNIEMSLDLSANLDMDISAQGATMSGSADASATADMSLDLTFDATPGIPFLPAMDKDLSVEESCDVSYSGSGSFDMEVDLTATGYIDTMMDDEIQVPDPVHYDDSVSGTFTDTYALYYSEATKKATCPALLNGGWAMVQNVDEIEISDIGGTRSEGFETTATYDPAKGMYTTYDPYLGPADSMVGDTLDTDTMTLEPVTKEDAESFNENPTTFLEGEGVSMPGSSTSGLLLPLLIVVIIVVVVVVVVVVVMRKKKTPPQQQQHPQPLYQQPPPPPQQYPPQDQYGQQQQYPPQQQQGQYPPPPPGQ